MERSWQRGAVGVGVVAILAGCRSPIVFDTPIVDDGTFARGTPTEAELARFHAAAEYSERADGRAVMVLRGEEVIFEDYENGHGAEEPTELYSGTKSFMCPVALLAIGDGVLDLDEPVSDTITEWQSDADGRKQDILVSDLLHFTSGLKDDRRNLTFDGLHEPQRIEDKYAFALDEPLVHDPGTTFEYGSTHPMVFGEVIKRKVGADPVAYLRDRLLDAVGMRFAGWNTDPSGNSMLAYGAWTTANEWMKFGVLVRDDGLWAGEQLVPAGAFATCMDATPQMPAYGLNWWLNAELDDEQAAQVPTAGVNGGGRMMPHAPADLFMAAGAKDSRLYIIPSLDLVVVRLGGGSWRWRDDAFLEALLGD